MKLSQPLRSLMPTFIEAAQLLSYPAIMGISGMAGYYNGQQRMERTSVLTSLSRPIACGTVGGVVGNLLTAENHELLQRLCNRAENTAYGATIAFAGGAAYAAGEQAGFSHAQRVRAEERAKEQVAEDANPDGGFGGR